MPHSLDIPLDLPSPGSRQKLAALHGQLRAAILDGRLKAGLRLPPSRELAAALGVSRNTVVAAYERLSSEGYVASRQGSGHYVADLAGKRVLRPSAHPLDDGRLAPAWRAGMPAMSRSLEAAPRFDFGVGLPDISAFPFELWRRLSARAVRQVSRLPAVYLPAQGQPALREAIARHVSFARAVACDPSDIIVTSGAQQAFDLLARVLVTPGRTVVAVEDPGFPPMRRAFEVAGAILAPVPVDEEGLVVSRLPGDTRVIYVTPSHQFPLGVAMSPERRRQLLDFAAVHSAVIVEDDYDSEFRFGSRPLDALQTLDTQGAVCYVGTFSKCLFPALRLGYVVAPPWLQPALAAAKQAADWHCDAASQETLAAFIAEGHLARHVRRMRKIYGERRQALLAVLEECGWQPWPSDAGLHVAARTPGNVPAADWIARAALRDVRVEPVARYAAGGAHEGLLFGLGAVPATDVAGAVKPWATLRGP
ncbi:MULTISPECIES: PLP-dependent aminotransferase family protein [Dyella]|uniref:PLP-dependent aminotransferase family protein n=2 Tax=Dyella TaxID=231454 RepID=A0A4R0YI78_9GAMM|nr:MULTISPECIES: PLP-dependent aminotransferase family protein [Dyella]TBR36769.1 PLP-dependent aminotransferase family protein [Dyella terrae]TCI08140.1 PLP-dependent aminotransferase family protein [Dyella soli]